MSIQPRLLWFAALQRVMGRDLIDRPTDWQAILRGDEREFERLVTAMTPQLVRLGYRLLGWDDEALEDVVQEVFVRVWARREKFAGRSSLETWITSIALNVCRQRIRRRRLWRRFIALVKPREFAKPPPREVPEEWPEVVRAMQSLPPKLHEVLVLHYLEEESIDRISEMLGIRKNTVEVRLHRARKRLQTALIEMSGDPDHADMALRGTATVI